jgi:toxin-antitoxin system PIN domain toxin
MSATVDVNVLLYASDETSPFHSTAVSLIERLVRGPDLFYLFWPVAIGYLRMATHFAIFPSPLAVERAVANVEQLVSLPHIRTPGEGDGFWQMYLATTSDLVVRANLVPDAHLVALMRQHGVGTIWTHDRDFKKFDGIRVRDPFE